MAQLHKFRKAKSLFATTLVSGIGTGTGDTITLNSVTGLPTDTEITLTFNRVNSDGEENPVNNMERITGTISGSNLVNYTRGVDGTTEQAHSAGIVVEYIWNADDLNDMVDGILKEHNQDGTHNDITADSITSDLIEVTNAIKFNAPEGFLLNGKIVPSVSSGNLTVALKTLAGTDPLETDPIYVRIGDTVRSITSALSITINAGTNWFNAGSAELATKEIDYFVYLGYNATDGVVIGFSRIPYATEYSQFSTTSTNEKYCAISTITNAVAGDDYVVIGRFAATLSAGAGYTWSVPTFTTINLIQRPIFTTRKLSYAPVGSAGGSMTFTINTVNRATYQISYNRISMDISVVGTTGGTANADMRVSVPVVGEFNSFGTGFYKSGTYGVIIAQTNGNFMQTFKSDISDWNIGSGIEVYVSANVTIA